MSKIVRAITEIIAKKHPVSDLHIVTGRPLLGRWPRGYQAISNYVIDDSDINDFLGQPGILGPDWRDRVNENGGTFEFATSMTTARLRLSIYEVGGTDKAISIIGRIIPKDIPTIENLGIPAPVLNVMKRSKGLFIITGPTGSGKSTTMAAMLHLVNTSRPIHILTLEDPIEFIHPIAKAVISQREIVTNVPSFGDGLTLAMRQRPDIIALGEVKDAKSAETMLHAAESGHLVLATMHTRNSEETISKLFSYFDKEEVQQKAHSIASSLIGVSTQVLVPSTDGSRLHLASEVMLNNAAISASIRDMRIGQIKNSIVSGAQDGMTHLNSSLAALVKGGKVEPRDAAYASYDLADLQKLGIK
jgi:twitching motility protein PilT